MSPYEEFETYVLKTLLRLLCGNMTGGEQEWIRDSSLESRFGVFYRSDHSLDRITAPERTVTTKYRGI